jgi:hypothetical protein
MLHNATADPLQGWVTNDDRGTQNIITSCFGITIVCLWSMLHLNVPAHDDTIWTIILQKARWMSLGLVYPELIMCFAYGQMMSAIESFSDMTTLDIKQGQWSVVHGFYADMGGFVLQLQDFEPFPITARQLFILVQTRVVPMPKLSVRDITDKSKGNWFVKGLAMWQTCYLLVTLIIRLIKGIAVTPLEIMTATIGFCAFATILVWFRKPLDVETPTIIHSSLNVHKLLSYIGPHPPQPWSETPMDFAEGEIYMTRKWSHGLTNLLIRMKMQSRPLKRTLNFRSPTSPRHTDILRHPK